MKDFIVREYREGDEIEINRLFNEIFGASRSLDEWRWKFRDGPANAPVIAVAESGGQIVAFNCFAFDPDDATRNYFGLQDTLALRAMKFNRALIDLSIEEGISIVDVDRILAELGGTSHATGAFQYSLQACDLICAELFRIMQDIGFFEHRPLIPQMGRKRA